VRQALNLIHFLFAGQMQLYATTYCITAWHTYFRVLCVDSVVVSDHEHRLGMIPWIPSLQPHPSQIIAATWNQERQL